MNHTYLGKRIDPVVLVVLSIITCGIYGAYYLYIIGQDINAVLGREAVNPILAIIGIFCSPIILYYLYTVDRAMVEIGTENDIPYNNNFILWLLLTLFCGVGIFVAYFQIPGFFNRLWDRNSGVRFTQ